MKLSGTRDELGAQRLLGQCMSNVVDEYIMTAHTIGTDVSDGVKRTIIVTVDIVSSGTVLRKIFSSQKYLKSVREHGSKSEDV